MKYLSNSADWRGIHAVEFDIDGTLYDEMEFISQVYRPISQIIADACGIVKRRFTIGFWPGGWRREAPTTEFLRKS